jgi:hypothetical protein
VGGVDVFVPVCNWSVEWSRPNVDQAYFDTITALTATTNNDVFYKWQQGEVLFRGANVRSSPGRWIITYQFSVSKNRTGVEVGNGITFDFVRGWDYLSIEYTRDAVTGLNIPKTATRQQLYAETDFSLLEIGV